MPQLPLEWAALTTAVAAWLAIRTDTATRRHTPPWPPPRARSLLAAAGTRDMGTPQSTRGQHDRQTTDDGFVVVPGRWGAGG